MRRPIAPLVAAAALAIAFVATPARAASPDVAAQLDAMLAPSFPASAPGAVVLVKRGEQVLLRKAYGLANVELAVPMRPDDVLRIGSITKQFTAAAILLLADEHKLALADPIGKYVDFPTHGATITLEHLLTHTSGIANYTEQPAFDKRAREPLTHAEVLALVKDLPLEFAPGTRWKYSNTNYYLLGMVIEKVAGKPYAQLLDERIFRPLGMAHTAYDDPARLVPGRAAGYDRRGTRLTNAEPIAMETPFAAGALVSTVDDLARWDDAIGRGKLLSKASWARAFTPYTLADGKKTDYGYGWIVGVLVGHPIVWHNGGIPGFNAVELRVPADKLLVVILCNSFPAPTNIDRLAQRLAAQALGTPLPGPPKPIHLDAKILDGYVGKYQLAPSFILTVTREGDRLFVQATGQPKLPLLASAPTEFFLEVVDAQLSFHPDAHGRATSVVLHQNGRDAPAQRVE